MQQKDFVFMKSYILFNLTHKEYGKNDLLKLESCHFAS